MNKKFMYQVGNNKNVVASICLIYMNCMMMHGLANARTVLLMLVSRKNLRMFSKID